MKSLVTFFSNLTASKSILLLLTPVLTALVSMKLALLGLVILILGDLITGIRKTHHQKGINFNPFKKIFWTSIKSYLLRQTWRKSYEYGFGIVCIVVLETLVFGTPISIVLIEKSFTLSELVTVVPAMIEIWSIFENFEAVSGRNILKRVGHLLPTQLNNIFKKKKDNLE